MKERMVKFAQDLLNTPPEVMGITNIGTGSDGNIQIQVNRKTFIELIENAKNIKGICVFEECLHLTYTIIDGVDILSLWRIE